MAEGVAIMKREQPDWREEYLFRYFKIWLRTNADAKPLADGSYLIADDIGDVKEKNWSRLTPYSLALPKEER